MTTPKSHGGARKGAGKPKINDKPIQVRLLPAQIEIAERLGNGNRSAGIRAALDMATSAKHPAV